MLSNKYNPMVCYDALYSTSPAKNLENMEYLDSNSGSRIEFPEGGFIDLPGIESPTEHDEPTFHSDIFKNTRHFDFNSGSRIQFPEGGFIDLPGIESPPEHDELMFHSDIFKNTRLLDSNSGSRIEFPESGFIDLTGIESPPEQDDLMFDSDVLKNMRLLGSNGGSRIELPEGGFIDLPGFDSFLEEDQTLLPGRIFQDYGLLERKRTATLTNQDHIASLFSNIKSLETKLAQKEQTIIKQERENSRLREHLNRFMQIVTDRNFELHNLRNEASKAVRDLHAWGTRLERENDSLHEEIIKKDAVFDKLLSEAKSVPSLRRLLEEGRNERSLLKENIKTLEKSVQDLITKNKILEHELTVLPKMMSTVNSESFVKAEIHTPGPSTESSVGPSIENANECCKSTVSEQKTCQAIEEDPEPILVLESQLVAAIDEKNNLLKKVAKKQAKRVLTPGKWLRNNVSEAQRRIRTDSLKRIN